MNTIELLERAGLVEPIVGTRSQVRIAMLRSRVQVLLGVALSTMVAYIAMRTVEAWNAGVGLGSTWVAFLQALLEMLPIAITCSAVANLVRLVEAATGQERS